MSLNLGLNLRSKTKARSEFLTDLQKAQLKAKKQAKTVKATAPTKAKLPGRRLEGDAVADRKIPLSLASTAKLTKRLDAYAKSKSVSRSVVFRKALRKYLEAQGA